MKVHKKSVPTPVALPSMAPVGPAAGGGPLSTEQERPPVTHLGNWAILRVYNVVSTFVL